MNQQTQMRPRCIEPCIAIKEYSIEGTSKRTRATGKELSEFLPLSTLAELYMIHTQRNAFGFTGQFVDTTASPQNIALHVNRGQARMQAIVMYLVTGKVGLCANSEDVNQYEYLKFDLNNEGEIVCRGVVPAYIGEDVMERGV